VSSISESVPTTSVAGRVLPERRLYPTTGAHGQVVHEIGRRVVSGGFSEGEILPREAELAEAHGVSRQAVREALKVLAAKGLVASRRRSGTRVLSRAQWNLLDPDVLAWHAPEAIPPRIVSDLLELRLLIEPAAAGMAASRARSDAAMQMERALHAMAASAPGSEAFYAADAEFHLALCAASGNEMIERLSNLLMPMCQSIFRLAGISAAGMPDHLPRSREIHAAIMLGDAIAARRLTEAIVTDSHRHLDQTAASARNRRR